MADLPAHVAQGISDSLVISYPSITPQRVIDEQQRVEAGTPARSIVSMFIREALTKYQEANNG